LEKCGILRLAGYGLTPEFTLSGQLRTVKVVSGNDCFSAQAGARDPPDRQSSQPAAMSASLKTELALSTHYSGRPAFHGYIAQPTRVVCALKKCPCVVARKKVVMSAPPKQQFVGRIAGIGCVSSTRPIGENT
jgi:hypothetical protein